MDDASLSSALTLDRFPRSSRYDPRWAIENLMGPNVLWLTEWLSEVMELKPGMKVMDLGPGKAVGSIFVAQEFGVNVWAPDLWIDAASNVERVRKAGLEDRVMPVDAEAHALPFDHEFFDAILSMDAYHYFGTDDLYIGYIAQFLKPGGRIGIVVPGVREELPEGHPPAWLKPFWEWDFCSFHSPEWWRTHWRKTGKVQVESAGWLEDGWKHWLLWNDVCREAGYAYGETESDMLREDAGRTLGFVRLVARKDPPAG